LKRTINSLYKGIKGKGDFFINKENNSSLIFRKSIFSIKDIKKGDKISKSNIDTFRANIGLKANNYFKVLGKKANKNIKKYSPIFKSDILF